MHSLIVQTNTKKDIPLTFQFKKSYYALFCIYLKVTVSCGPHHRNLAQKNNTAWCDCRMTAKTFCSNSYWQQFAQADSLPSGLSLAKAQQPNMQLPCFYFFKDSFSFLSQRYNLLVKMIDVSLIPCSANQLENDRRQQSIQAERGYESLEEVKPKRGRQE